MLLLLTGPSAMSGSVPLLKYLVSLGCPLTAANSYGTTPLVCTFGKKKQCCFYPFLFFHGCNPEKRKKEKGREQRRSV
jgi:hypothetical protein